MKKGGAFSMMNVLPAFCNDRITSLCDHRRGNIDYC
ncbi:hypothetical protein MUK42_08209 [Musa troglodytarum]|uniref:Uncharacterized protein n=1 Tax=Musa troglodytarum TaxID=320322 RepID=A0A9E7EK84_9LILI|nr:hypothetical protein MUK42_08209 [Musa troglodytarum]